MCFGSPSIPQVKAAPTLRELEPATRKIRGDERNRAAARAGRSSTILTGGLLGAPDSNAKTLLGA